MNELERSLNNLNQTLPSAPNPVGNYQASIKSGDLVYVSGQLPILDGNVMFTGTLGKDLTVEQGREAAKLAALNALSQLTRYLKSDTINQLIKVEGFIRATPEFTEHAQVLNGASDLFSDVLEGKSGHIRTVLGCSSLPMGVPVEISVVVELESVSSPVNL